MKQRLIKIWGIIFWGVALVHSVQGKEIQVNAYFNPNRLEMGSVGLYLIVVTGTHEDPKAEMPSINGLRLTLVQTKKSFNSMEGRMEEIYGFAVEPLTPGEHVIEGAVLDIRGKKYPVPKAVVWVTNSQNQGNDDSKVAQLDPMWLDLNLERDTFYLGECFHVSINLYVESSIYAHLIRNFPEKDGDAFTSALRESNYETVLRRSVVKFDSRDYHKIVWDDIICGLKEGEHSLRFITIVQIEGERRGFFHNSVRQLPLETKAKKIKIKQLPERDKPKNFTGAIGDFKISRMDVPKHDIELGEPVTLSFTIQGKGNFDLIQAPVLRGLEGWKSYPPKSIFRPSDSLGYSGEKTFEYILIPQSESINQFPEIAFNYFSPQDQVYRTMVADSIPVEVISAKSQHLNHANSHIKSHDSSQKQDKDDLMHKVNAPPQIDSSGFSTSQFETLEGKDGLPFSIKSESGKWYESLDPHFKRWPFWAIQGFLFACIPSFIFFQMRAIRLKRDVYYRNRLNAKKILERELEKARAAVLNENHLAFWEASEESIRACVDSIFCRKSSTSTPDELVAFLKTKHLSEQTIAAVNDFFERIDMSRFSGYYGQVNVRLKEELDVLEKLLIDLEKKS